VGAVLGVLEAMAAAFTSAKVTNND
jgi:hypothetical protein